MDYRDFIAQRLQCGSDHGFEPIEIPDFLFPFQRHLVEWAIRKGRSALLADCGLGKTPMQLTWADNVVRFTGRPVLILTPLAVSAQTVREADKFGFICVQSRDGDIGSAMTVTNYEKLKYFNPNDFAGVVCDESSILKNFDGVTRAAVTEFMRTVPYRLLCTATAAPNDFVELGTSSEALGELGFQDMVTRFFRKDVKGGHRGWARTVYDLKGHAVHDFWRWVCSWARACRKPSDLGFEDGSFLLPSLDVREHIVVAKAVRSGYLFNVPAVSLRDQQEERRRSIEERCERVAELVSHDRPAVAWCHLNDEGDMLEQMIPGSVQVSGSDPDERKEEAFLGFARGDFRVLVTKPEIAGFGLNWQHCAHQTFFPSHSFERYYQAVRRCWRFGQEHPVSVDIVSSEGEAGVHANLSRKARQADEMFAKLVELMNDHLRVEKSSPFNQEEILPSWLSLTSTLTTDGLSTMATV